MKKSMSTMAVLVSAALVIPVLAGSGCKTTCPSGACGAPTGEMSKAVTQETEIPVLTTDALKTLLDAKAPVVLLDARSGKYDDGKRIPGAQSLNDKSTAKEIAAVVAAKDKLVVTYCSNLKCPASDRLAKHLTKLGYTNVLEYPEGIAGWIAAGNKVVQAK